LVARESNERITTGRKGDLLPRNPMSDEHGLNLSRLRCADSSRRERVRREISVPTFTAERHRLQEKEEKVTAPQGKEGVLKEKKSGLWATGSAGNAGDTISQSEPRASSVTQSEEAHPNVEEVLRLEL
jgi:hypothetical protein